MHHHGIGPGKDQAGVPVVVLDPVRGRAVHALDLSDYATPVTFAHGIAMYQEPIANRRIHTSHIGTRNAVRKVRFLSFAGSGERSRIMTGSLRCMERTSPPRERRLGAPIGGDAPGRWGTGQRGAKSLQGTPAQGPPRRKKERGGQPGNRPKPPPARAESRRMIRVGHLNQERSGQERPADGRDPGLSARPTWPDRLARRE
ncbi:hypothetical protein GCM10020001_018410 [Nonomuraea salmonea]